MNTTRPLGFGWRRCHPHCRFAHPRRSAAGFTLIELLTVIAIIAILAGLTATVLPRALEKAKITRAREAMNNINTAMTHHFTNQNTYPARYGYRTWESRELDLGTADDTEIYYLRPYTVALNLHGVEDVYDEFSIGYDTNGDDYLNLLEFSPIGNPATNVLDLPEVIYDPNNVDPALDADISRQLSAATRPFVYVPVNRRQFQFAERFWLDNDDIFATTWDDADDLLQDMAFPPQNYDAYVLVSAGPAGTTAGVIPDSFIDTSDVDAYHINGLRAYFLATRDLNNNNVLDFDFEARTQDDEATKLAAAGDPDWALLPDGTRGQGPMIHVSR